MKGAAPGQQFSHFEVIEKIGEGGMGEVYRARDTLLGRDVAVKLLPSAFVNDPERMARFSREAQFVASLNHPNIAAIYGIEQSNGTPVLVLELVEGPTVADRITQGPCRSTKCSRWQGRLPKLWSTPTIKALFIGT